MEDHKSPTYLDEHREEQGDAHFPGSGEPVEKMSVGRYLATRFSTLKPPMDRSVQNPGSWLSSLWDAY